MTNTNEMQKIMSDWHSSTDLTNEGFWDDAGAIASDGFKWAADFDGDVSAIAGILEQISIAEIVDNINELQDDFLQEIDNIEKELADSEVWHSIKEKLQEKWDEVKIEIGDEKNNDLEKETSQKLGTDDKGNIISLSELALINEIFTMDQVLGFFGGKLTDVLDKFKDLFADFDLKEFLGNDYYKLAELIYEKLSNLIVSLGQKVLGLADSVIDKTTKTCLTMFIQKAIKQLSFGFVDNFIMVTAGSAIDSVFGDILCGGDSMCSAGWGNAVSDAFAEEVGEGIQTFLTGVGVSEISKEDLETSGCEDGWLGFLSQHAGAIGIFAGCILGLLPMKFMAKAA